jgi:hypothetical protein
MANEVKVGNLADLNTLESSCNSFSEGLRSAVGAFKSATSDLGSGWRDAKVRDIESMSDEIVSVCEKAQNIVGDLLVPFIQRKRAALENRPN